jgi:hypothetical protein
MSERVQRINNHALTISTYATDTQVLAQDFMKTLGPLALKEKEDIKTKFDKTLGTI